MQLISKQSETLEDGARGTDQPIVNEDILELRRIPRVRKASEGLDW